jgi:hypothetical protein
VSAPWCRGSGHTVPLSQTSSTSTPNSVSKPLNPLNDYLATVSALSADLTPIFVFVARNYDGLVEPPSTRLQMNSSSDPPGIASRIETPNIPIKSSSSLPDAHQQPKAIEEESTRGSSRPYTHCELPLLPLRGRALCARNETRRARTSPPTPASSAAAAVPMTPPLHTHTHTITPDEKRQATRGGCLS